MMLVRFKPRQPFGPLRAKALKFGTAVLRDITLIQFVSIILAHKAFLAGSGPALAISRPHDAAQLDSTRALSKTVDREAKDAPAGRPALAAPKYRRIQ
jgi:hypothetical protein